MKISHGNLRFGNRPLSSKPDGILIKSALQHHRVMDIFLVAVAAPSEAAAHQHVVVDDLVGLEGS
jgi:hypothetical protein